jgi:hypothetical protein
MTRVALQVLNRGNVRNDRGIVTQILKVGSRLITIVRLRFLPTSPYLPAGWEDA